MSTTRGDKADENTCSFTYNGFNRGKRIRDEKYFYFSIAEGVHRGVHPGYCVHGSDKILRLAIAVHINMQYENEWMEICNEKKMCIICSGMWRDKTTLMRPTG